MKKLFILFFSFFIVFTTAHGQNKQSAKNILKAESCSYIIIPKEDTLKFEYSESYTGEFLSYDNLADSLLLNFFNKYSSKKKLVIIFGNLFIIIEYEKAKRNEEWREINEANISIIEYLGPLTQKTFQFNIKSKSETILFHKKRGSIWFKNIEKQIILKK